MRRKGKKKTINPFFMVLGRSERWGVSVCYIHMKENALLFNLGKGEGFGKHRVIQWNRQFGHQQNPWYHALKPCNFWDGYRVTMHQPT